MSALAATDLGIRRAVFYVRARLLPAAEADIHFSPYACRIWLHLLHLVQMVAAAAWWPAAVWPALWRALAGLSGGCRARERGRAWHGSGRMIVL